jgi:hypothetical protein
MCRVRVDQNTAFRDVEAPTRLEDLPLNYFSDGKRELGVRHHLKVVTDGRDPHKGGQERKVFSGDSLDSVPHGTEEGVSADREVEGAGRVALFDSRATGAH